MRAKLIATVLGVAFGVAFPLNAADVPASITTPDKVEARIGPLEFKDGAPSKVTLDKVYDAIDFAHAQRAFADTFQGVSIHAIRKGLQSVGVKWPRTPMSPFNPASQPSSVT